MLALPKASPVIRAASERCRWRMTKKPLAHDRETRRRICRMPARPTSIARSKRRHVAVNSINVSTPEAPFGGVKESGYGSEGGIESLQAYLSTKFISRG
jgi:hypothetical protein